MGLENPIFVVPNSIDADEFKTLVEPDIFYQRFPHTHNKKIILFLGRIHPVKGLDLLIPAFAQVHAQYPDTHLVIAGPDSEGYLVKVKQLIHDYHCTEAVTFTGMITDSLKLSALVASDIYVAPSYSEAFSISILEGMASGLPSVITTGCNFAQAGEAGVASVVEPQVPYIRDALMTYLKNSGEAQEIGQQARQFVLENYTWTQMSLKFMQNYQALYNGQDLPHRYSS